MSKEIRVGGMYRCKIGRNSVAVQVLNTCAGGWEVATASGKRLTIKDAARLSPPAAATPEGDAQVAPGAKTRAATPKGAKPVAGRNVGQGGAPLAQETPKARKTGLVDAAIEVLRGTGQPMNTQEMVEAVLAKGLWKSDGKTPAATLYSSILREIQKKGDEARFVKTERGKFALKS